MSTQFHIGPVGVGNLGCVCPGDVCPGDIADCFSTWQVGSLGKSIGDVPYSCSYNAILVGDENYLASIRRIVGPDLFRKNWSANQEPSVTAREAVIELRRIGAEVALDEKGEVRRVQFIIRELKRLLQDTDMHLLVGFKAIEAVSLAGSREISGAGLAALHGLRSLRALNLRNTNLMDAFLADLEQ